MSKRKANRLKAGVTLGIAFAILIMGSSMYLYQDDETGNLHFKMNSALADYALPAGESGWIGIVLYKNDATPGVTYAGNYSTLSASGDCLASFDTDGWSTTTFETETSFDIIVCCRFNKTHLWDADHFDDSRARVYLNVSGATGASDWAVGSDFTDSLMTRVVSVNDSGNNYIWINFYLNNGGSGYQLADDGELIFDDPQIQARFS
jgi:hypothetical protein